jgi:hypothetical protein
MDEEMKNLMRDTFEELMELSDHIELVHERVLAPPYTFTRLRAIHEDMHRVRDDWGHEH